MPTVTIGRDKLFAALGRTYTDEQFRDLCFEFGIELDDVTSERQMFAQQQGEERAAQMKNLSDEVLYKIDVPANRYDLLCGEGLSMALRVFTGAAKPPRFAVARAAQTLVMTARRDVARVRPFVVAAVLRGVRFDATRYESFIDLQEKLHQNICRKRKLVAIGTHDLDTIEAPFSYEALPPRDIRFKPLNEDREFDAEALFHYYREEKQQSPLKPYLKLIEDSPVFPVIYDAKRRVLSLPPIVNGEHSKIRLETRNVLVECTATDLTKAHIVLNTMVTMFSCYCATPFQVEAVQVVYEDGRPSQLCPQLESKEFVADAARMARSIGVASLPTPKVAELLTHMMLETRIEPDGRTLKVSVPPTRSDVLHECDIAEDLAIAYGFNNLVRTVPSAATVGREVPLNKLSDQTREVVAQAGFLEVLTWILVSSNEVFAHLRRHDDGRTAVVLENPVSKDFNVTRTTLLSGLLKTVASNADSKLPIRIFEVGDVVLLDPATEVGARNARRVAALYCGTTSGLEHIHGLVDRVLQMHDCRFVDDAKKDGAPHGRADHVYHYEASEDPTFFEGRRANVILGGRKVGAFGIVHPEVLKHFQIAYPCSMMELDLEVFL
jgi:phenylalanyl-tRNA synthetase beta chain